MKHRRSEDRNMRWSSGVDSSHLFVIHYPFVVIIRIRILQLLYFVPIISALFALILK